MSKSKAFEKQEPPICEITKLINANRQSMFPKG